MENEIRNDTASSLYSSPAKGAERKRPCHERTLLMISQAPNALMLFVPKEKINLRVESSDKGDRDGNDTW